MPRRHSNVPKTAEPLTFEDAIDAMDLDFKNDDTTSVGHLMLRQQRQMLFYFRLIEHEMPKLVGLSPSTILAIQLLTFTPSIP